MKIRRHVLAALTVLTAAFAVGGLAERTADAQEIRVVIPPPAVRVEVPGPRPGPMHVWQDGHWLWRNDGKIRLAPGSLGPSARGAHDLGEGRLGQRRRRLALRAGSLACGRRARPHPRRARQGRHRAPARADSLVAEVPVGHAWVKGHWSWDGARFVWVGGHALQIPAGLTAWEPGHWYASGGRWFYANGYWR